MVWSCGQDFSLLTTEQLEEIIEQQVQKIRANNILAEHKKQRLQIIQNETKVFLEKNREKLVDSEKALSVKLEDEKAEIDKLESSINRIKNELIDKRSMLKILDQQIDDSTKSKLETKLPIAEKIADYRPKAAVEPFSRKSPGALGEAYLSSKGFLTAYCAVEEVLRSEQISLILNSSNNRRFCLYGGQNDEAPPPDLIPRNEKCNNNNNNATLLSLDHDPDNITIRNDTLRAAKRRSSWADPQHHHGVYSNSQKIDDEISVENRETEHIKALLAREQQKGRSTVNLSWIFGQLPANKNNEEMREKENKQEAKNEQTTTIIDVLDEKMDDLVTKIDIEGKIDAPKVEETLESKFKSILKKRIEESSPFEIHYVDPQPIKRHIRFDPLALLLDAALEGDLLLVKWCSEQLGTVDESNGEGITALHNAICAGHYEIVRFLVEADADVNAQDSDGWTPLHCAASCNNLPAVQFLVERGACVFAQTLNDQQTPLDKCEEDSEGFDGCSEYLKNIQDKMGKSLNESRVFAAFPFEGEHEDEFQSLEIGQELIVLDRDRNIIDGEKDDQENPNETKIDEDPTTSPVIDRSKIYFEDYWWMVRKTDDENVVGLVPRNYLALYPKLSIQRHWKTKIEVDRN